MKKFDIKSIFLGIGMGIILTSLASMIYFVGTTGTKDSKKDVLQGTSEAEGVFKSSSSDFKLPETETKSAKPSVIQTQSPTPTPAKSKEPTATPKSPESQKTVQNEYIFININPGDNLSVIANRLLNAGIISNRGVFIAQAEKMGLGEKIEVGKFKVSKSMNNKEIINIITKRGN